MVSLLKGHPKNNFFICAKPLKHTGILFTASALTIFGKEIETGVKKLMLLRYPAAIICIAATLLITGCHKRYYPNNANNNSSTTTNSSAPAANKTTTTVVKKPVVKKTPTVMPKVITVNDSAAKKSVDGRLYYDVEGHRYWRNYDDGKYYLFNKSMFTNKAFKPH
jgi:hypothetical protein